MTGRTATATAVRPWIGTVVRLVLAVVMLAAGLLKARDIAASVRAVHAYDLLPGGVADLVGYALPFLEIAVGVFLLLGLATRVAALVTAVLMALFVLGILSAWARGLSIDCGCFGGGGTVEQGDTGYLGDVMRDGALLVGALLLAVWPRTRLSVDP